MTIIVTGAILLLILALWIAWKIICAINRRPRDPGYVTVCVYGENGTRFLVRRPISKLREVDDRDIPDFLRH